MNAIFAEALTCLMKAGILAVTGMITYFIRSVLIPWLKERQLYATIVQLVQAAEKLSEGNKLGSESKIVFVRRLLCERGIIITPEIEVMIESAVMELDIMKTEIITALSNETEEKAHE